MDDKIAKLHSLIYNRKLTPWPPLNKLNTSYIPDPVKWNRLNQIQKRQHITNANIAIDTGLKYGLYTQTTRPELYANIAIPPGFNSPEEVLGAISRDRFGSKFEYR